jgi:CO dehydrogenase/acetyl-CoA synthase epsilon subunit
MGGGLTTYSFFMYVMENHQVINEPFYLCCVSSFTQIRTPDNKLITIIGIKNSDKCTKYSGCIQVSVYVNSLIYAHKNTHILIDSQIDSKKIIEMAQKVKQLQNIHVVSTSDMFSSMLNNTYDHVIILSRRMYIANIIDSIKHMKQLCSYEEINNSICITSSYTI